MNYSDIKIFSCPRSGTNYVGALVQENFLGGGDFSNRFYKNAHLMEKSAERFIQRNPNTACIYVCRNFEGVINSIFNARYFFGLTKVNTLDELLNSRFCDVWDNSHQSKDNYVQKVYRNLEDEKSKYRRKVSTYFSKIELKPGEYWEKHINSWFSLDKKYNNVLIVKYENFLDNNYFDTEMKKIADFLGVERKNFKNIDRTVGVIPVGNT